MMDEFNSTYGLKTKPLDSDLDGMLEIIGSEYDELSEEYCQPAKGVYAIPNPDNFVKEGLDLIYATAQQLRERGVNVDLGLAEVHRSNMSKTLSIYDPDSAYYELKEAKKRYPDAELIPHGNVYVIKCKASGKVIKPSTYSKAVIDETMYTAPTSED